MVQELQIKLNIKKKQKPNYKKSLQTKKAKICPSC